MLSKVNTQCTLHSALEAARPLGHLVGCWIMMCIGPAPGNLALHSWGDPDQHLLMAISQNILPRNPLSISTKHYYIIPWGPWRCRSCPNWGQNHLFRRFKQLLAPWPSLFFKTCFEEPMAIHSWPSIHPSLPLVSRSVLLLINLWAFLSVVLWEVLPCNRH